jgi:hypothetical protein
MEELNTVRAELAASGLSPERVAAIRVVSSGRLAGMPYLRVASGDGAVEEWRLLRHATYPKRYPVILDDVEDVPPMHEMWRAKFPSIPEVIAAGQRIDERIEWQPLLKAELDRWRPPAAWWPPRATMTQVRGAWPEIAVTRDRFWGPSYVGMAHQRATVDVAFPVCPEPWMIPAYLQCEPHNDLPEADVQCAVLRSWHRRFGAELVWNNGVVYELAVARPPESKQAALELAEEHYLFCPDRLDQGTPSEDFSHEGTLEALAASLMVSPVWYFWWD